ncbi:MAG: acylphosphatase [Alphaproteobacteria bacterium]|nr:acylphosphatase [Alphaproteobacteria bacterium]MBP7759613.1 acylphosphatase [Alphaproteobacteria bacterium]MBP7763152.1 acylphosphatase [Alphaproteobacteria bacterium]MBP7904611.1 acylphosphatase [Alphaproteobacteria bacterium]
MERVTKRLKIFGRVQGVGYRAWMVQTATEMDLTGWVRNREDGSVEAVVTGDDEAVRKLIASCYDGPKTSKVETISVSDGLDELLTVFEQRENA